MKKIIIAIGILVVILTSYYLLHLSNINSSYNGIPTVACVDYAQKTLQNFSFNVSIKINGQLVTLPPNLGHDYGNCLRVVHTNDSSGKVLVTANDTNTYTLGSFFDAWKVTFNNSQIMSYLKNNTHDIVVSVNGKEIAKSTNYRSIPLSSGARYIVTYE